MATAAQTAANRENAALSTGPRTEDGKSIASRNAEKYGLFSTRNFVRPDEEEVHEAFRLALLEDLQPVGPLEESLAMEIFNATWRLRRCGEVEAHLSAELDPMENTADDSTLPAQNAVDRARNQANRLLLRSTAELRRAQTERQIRLDSFPPGACPDTFGLAQCREIARARMAMREINGMDNMEAMINRAHNLSTGGLDPENIGPEWMESESAKQTQSTPRNALCPCGSGGKYKRCCGKNAPAVHSAAQNRAVHF